MAGVHEDFGEKIGGAKKDLWKDRGLYVDDLDAMNDREAEKFVKKDNIWKKPDYQAMLDEGVPLGVVYFIKKARDSLNASPQYYRTDDTPEKRLARQKEYIQTVRELQEVVSGIRTMEDAMRAYDRFFVENGYLEQVQGWGGGAHYRATKKGQDNPVITNKLSKNLMAYSASYFERNFTQKAQKEQFGVSKGQKVPKGYAIHFNDGKNTYSKNNDWKPGTYYVTKGYAILQANFETREAALKWVQELAKGQTKSGKTRFVPPQLAHVKRTGPDYRSGAEITGQHYLDTFGFRGGEFGNWMNQNDRQTSLNMGFEALKDTKSAGAYDELAENVELPEPAEASEETAGGAETDGEDSGVILPVVDFEALKKNGPDIIGWITLPDSAINYPVTQTDNNEYYLRHLYDGTYNKAGCLFADYENQADFSDRNTIIYGHNMRDGSMFAVLNQYDGQPYFDTHRQMYLVTPTGGYVMEIFSAFAAKPAESGSDTSPWRLNWKDDGAYTTWLRAMAERSVVETDVSVTSSDKVLTLSTCTPGGASRFIVMGKLVEVQ